MAVMNSHLDRKNDVVLESDIATMHPLISWRSVVAGLLIAFFSMLGLLALGMAFGGIGLDEATSFRSAGIFSGIWFLVSALLSMFIGSYFAARVSKFQTGRIGSAQGLVIAALFIGFFLYQGLAAIGTAGQMAGNVIGSAAGVVSSGVQKAADAPGVSNTVSTIAEDAIGDLNLRSDPRTVATGVATRIANGNVEGAKNYLSRQSGISRAEANTRIDQLSAQMNQAIDKAKEGAASALKSTGFTLFLLTILGALASVAGGALGSMANFKHPLNRENVISQHSARPQHV